MQIKPSQTLTHMLIVCAHIHTEGEKPILFIFLIFIVIQLQLYAFSPQPSTPPEPSSLPHLNPPP